MSGRIFGSVSKSEFWVGRNLIDCNEDCVKWETLESTKFRCVGENTREKWYPQCESHRLTLYGLGKENSFCTPLPFSNDYHFLSKFVEVAIPSTYHRHPGLVYYRQAY